MQDLTEKQTHTNLIPLNHYYDPTKELWWCSCVQRPSPLDGYYYYFCCVWDVSANSVPGVRSTFYNKVTRSHG